MSCKRRGEELPVCASVLRSAAQSVSSGMCVAGSTAIGAAATTACTVPAVEASSGGVGLGRRMGTMDISVAAVQRPAHQSARVDMDVSGTPCATGLACTHCTLLLIHRPTPHARSICQHSHLTPQSLYLRPRSARAHPQPAPRAGAVRVPLPAHRSSNPMWRPGLLRPRAGGVCLQLRLRHPCAGSAVSDATASHGTHQLHQQRAARARGRCDECKLAVKSVVNRAQSARGHADHVGGACACVRDAESACKNRQSQIN